MLFTYKSVRLQWGHDKIVMEVRYDVVVPVAITSFNGAMTK